MTNLQSAAALPVAEPNIRLVQSSQPRSLWTYTIASGGVMETQEALRIMRALAR